MRAVYERIQERSLLGGREELPVSNGEGRGMRRRLSSFSERIPPLPSSSDAAAAFRRTMSMPAVERLRGWSLRGWWDWGRRWILSRRAHFAGDLETNEAALGGGAGTWGRLLYRLRRCFRRPSGGKGFRYDSFSYAQNFDDGVRAED
ncbi:unnamed protein product [Spirodela intermedia]|uniref:Uncharacterized protein n=1 Tax=Spirodela intermedia TaxID=51605 RepID=A0A7I8LI76_SPIIN|nr:unnamed protein product [Spirodela intermedia]